MQCKQPLVPLVPGDKAALPRSLTGAGCSPSCHGSVWEALDWLPQQLHEAERKWTFHSWAGEETDGDLCLLWWKTLRFIFCSGCGCGNAHSWAGMSRVWAVPSAGRNDPRSLLQPRGADGDRRGWAGAVASTREGLPLIPGFTLHYLLGVSCSRGRAPPALCTSERAWRQLIISFLTFLPSGVWGWELRWVIKCFILPRGSLLFPVLWFCRVWGFLGQINPDFFPQSTLGLSSCPHSHHMKWFSPLHVCRIFPNNFVFMVIKTNCGAVCHSWLVPGN